MIWALLLVVAALAAPAGWAWYLSGRQLAATTEAEQWRLVRLAAVVSAAVGVAILAGETAGHKHRGPTRLRSDWADLRNTACPTFPNTAWLGWLFTPLGRAAHWRRREALSEKFCECLPLTGLLR